MYNIPLDRAYLIALWLETYLFGAYTIIFLTALYLLLWKRPSGVSWTLIIPLIILYTLATTHVIIVLIRSIQGFIGRGNQELGGATEYFLEASSPLNVANMFIYMTNNLVGDCVLIWRCYVVWGKSRKVMVVPCLLWLCTAVTGYNSAYQFILLKRGIFSPALEYWAKAFFCCTLVTNLLVTGLIAGRIWAHGRKLDKSVGSLPSMGPQYWGILAIIIESGALYSSALIIEIALYASKTNGIYVLFDGMAQVIGVVPTMIVVLVGTGRAKGDTITGTSGSMQFQTRRTGVSDITTAHSYVSQHRESRRRRTQPDLDLDLNNLPAARTITLPGGDNWPLGNKGHSLDLSFGDEMSRSSAAIEKEEGRFREDHRAREYLPLRAPGASSALDAAV